MATTGTAPTTGDLLEVPSGVARLRYFYGQLLTQRDLSAEQGYHVLLRRLMQRELLGVGTVAGLKVEATNLTTSDSVWVRAGLAIDPDGRELLLVSDVCVPIAEPPRTPSNPTDNPGTPYVVTTPYTRANVASDVAAYWGAAFGAGLSPTEPNDVVTLALWLWAVMGNTGTPHDDPSGNAGAGDYPLLASRLNLLAKPAGFTLQPGQRLLDYLFDALVGTTYLGLRYVERGKEPSPAVLDGSCCGDVACFPARGEEGVMIVGQSTPFTSYEDPAARAVDPYYWAKIAMETTFVSQENLPGFPTAPPFFHPRTVLYDYILGSFRGLPPRDEPCVTATPPVVPLAYVYWARYGVVGQHRIGPVNNYMRPFAPGVAPVRAWFDAVTKDVSPLATSPRILALSTGSHQQLQYPTGATEVLLRATPMVPLNPSIAATTWQIDFYPRPPGGVAVTWSSTSSPSTLTITVALDTTNGDVVLKFQSNPIGGAVVLPSGTYVWRVNEGSELKANVTGAVLAGELRVPLELPMGSQIFAAMFYVP